MAHIVLKPGEPRHAELNKIKIVTTDIEGGGQFYEFYVDGVRLRLLGGEQRPKIDFVGGQIHLTCTIAGIVDSG